MEKPCIMLVRIFKGDFMNCIENLRPKPIPNDVFLKSTRLYYQMGKNDYYEKLFETNYQFISKNVANQDAYAFFKLFFQDLKIGESRLRTLLLDSTVPKNNPEQIYKNLIYIFRQVKKKNIEPFSLTVVEINDLVGLIYKNTSFSSKVQYRRIKNSTHSLISKEHSSMREKLEELIEKYNQLKKEKIYESLILSVNFTVDFLNMKIYTGEKNEMIAIIILYIVLIQEGFIVSNYVSFFSKVRFYKDDLFEAISKSKFQWQDGLAEVMPLVRYLIKIYTELYNNLSDKARDYEYELGLEISKSDYVENTIMKLGEVFAKEEIRERHPLISDSTINRTLKRLQEENKIRPLGKGRSAKWIKLIKNPKKINFQEQLRFNLGEEDE